VSRMTLAEFDRLRREDFDNGAVVGEIRNALKALSEAREALGRAVLAMERAEADLHLAGQQIWGRLPGLSDGLDAARAALRRIAEGGGE